MADATLEHYSELASCLIIGQHPILPKPEWGQDAAMIAFAIDRLRETNAELRDLCSDAALFFEALDETGPLYDKLRAAAAVID